VPLFVRSKRQVMPGPMKPFEVFQSDDAVCRQWAAQQTELPQMTPSIRSCHRRVLGRCGAWIRSGDWCQPMAILVLALQLVQRLVSLAGRLRICPAYEAGYAAQTRYVNAYVQCCMLGKPDPGCYAPKATIRRPATTADLPGR